MECGNGIIFVFDQILGGYKECLLGRLGDIGDLDDFTTKSDETDPLVPNRRVETFELLD